MLPASTSHARPSIFCTHKHIRPGWRQSRHAVDLVTLRFVCHSFRPCTLPGRSGVCKSFICTSLSLAHKKNKTRCNVATQWLCSRHINKINVKRRICNNFAAKRKSYKEACYVVCWQEIGFFSAQHLSWWKYVFKLGWLLVSGFFEPAKWTSPYPPLHHLPSIRPFIQSVCLCPIKPGPVGWTLVTVLSLKPPGVLLAHLHKFWMRLRLRSPFRTFPWSIRAKLGLCGPRGRENTAKEAVMSDKFQRETRLLWYEGLFSDRMWACWKVFTLLWNILHSEAKRIQSPFSMTWLVLASWKV